MTGTQWLLLISLAVTLLFTCLLLIDAITEGRLKGKMLRGRSVPSVFEWCPLPDRNQGLRLSSFSTKQRLRLSSFSTTQGVWLKRLVLGVLVILNVILYGLLLWHGERAVESTSTQSVTPGGVSSSAGRSPALDLRSGSAEEEETIQLEDLAESAKPFETVRIQGTYRGGADTFLSLQRLEGGKWLAFPLRTKTDLSGQFTTYVELGQPGRYRLRVLDPESGVKSKPFVLVIKS